MGEYKILNRIDRPEDLKKLSRAEITELTDEIRDFLVENIRVTGGHLSSNLGVVELTVALHRVLDLPHDHLIWDVGHQSYVHKILTGRRDNFHTLRAGGGLAGFTSREESEYDCFGAGHSSTSLSAAIGFAEADRLCGSDAVTVAVVGDGAFTGGMIHEALNNCAQNLRLIIILNENEMSISKNIGHFAKNIAKLRAGKSYLKTKRATRNFIRRIPLIGKGMFNLIKKCKKSLKNAMYGSNYFEDMGLYYLGPVNGHDTAALERLLEEAKAANQSTLIHVKTVKGKGYEPAESHPDSYHSMSKSANKHQNRSFSQIFGEKLTAMADTDSRICAITAAMAQGTGLDAFAAAHRSRFFDVGIAEEHALTFAAGLAAEGMRPVAAIYSTFLQRAYDSIIHDIALQRLPVIMCVDRAGINADDGPTHHGVFDVAFLSQIPGLAVYTPTTAAALEAAMEEAMALSGPSAIRYPKGCPGEEIEQAFYPDGKVGVLNFKTDFDPADKPEVLIITDGVIVKEALRAKKMLEGQTKPGIVLIERLSPYRELAEGLAETVRSANQIVFLEEEIKAGGMGMLLSEALRELGALDGKKYSVMALENAFIRSEKNKTVYESAGLSAEDIVNRITLTGDNR